MPNNIFGKNFKKMKKIVALFWSRTCEVLESQDNEPNYSGASLYEDCSVIANKVIPL